MIPNIKSVNIFGTLQQLPFFDESKDIKCYCDRTITMPCRL